MDEPQMLSSSLDKPGRPHLILLVEDNLNDEMLALRAFKKVDISLSIQVARDGLEALDYLKDPESPVPDLVLLDLKLPKVNGLEVLKGLRAIERARRIPVVVFTSSNEQADVVGCFDAGANGFVRKSVDFQEYMEKISKLTDYWLNVNEPCIVAVARCH
jgi:CheY-like chemotaxis protein